MILIGILIAFHFFYLFFYKKIKIKKVADLYARNISDTYFLVTSVLFLICKTLLFRNFTLQNFYLRKSADLLLEGKSHLLTVISSVLYLFPLVMLLHLALFWRGKVTFIRGSILMILLLSAFPTSLSRTVFGIFLGSYILLQIPNLVKKNYFTLSFIALFAYVFPFMDQFRRIKSVKEIKFGFNLDFFKTAHFDSYYNFGLIMFEVPVQYGRQLLGVVLFFVPREIWPNKPVGSGAFMADHLNMNFTNLSANYFAEGYINFGGAGIVLFLIILVWSCAYLDRIGVRVQRQNPPLFVLYLQVIFVLFYLLRGDLMSSFALLFTIVLFNMIVLNILYKIRR